jgi:hypothetical protein
MAIQTKDDAQSKADRRVDRSLNDSRPKKFIPLMDRKFSDLVSLEDQLKWVELKKKQKDKNQTW